jgi:hypothetical protein
VAAMLPTLEGVIARRTLLNYWIDPEVVRPLVPKELELATVDGLAVAGTCLIRLEHLRPKHVPSAIGISSENMAHRIAIRYRPKDEGELRDGVFVWRRQTDRGMVKLLGGRLFPGVHGRSKFEVEKKDNGLEYRVTSEDPGTNVELSVRSIDAWPGSRLFSEFDDVRTFFEKGDHGFSCTLKGDQLEGMQLRTTVWNMEPLIVERVASAFYDDTERFPKGSIGLDGAVLMRGIPHEWHELDDVPELAGAN